MTHGDDCCEDKHGTTAMQILEVYGNIWEGREARAVSELYQMSHAAVGVDISMTSGAIQ